MKLTASVYQACIDGLDLLEGEEIRLKYGCVRRNYKTPSLFSNKGYGTAAFKGLLVFTNDNMIFMQQDRLWSSNYSQALRIPLEQISGVLSGGIIAPHIRIIVGFSGNSETHEFLNFFDTKEKVHEIKTKIEKLLTAVRQEKKRLAQEALAKGTNPAMIFCRFCGARNKSDQSICVNCGAPLTK